MKDYEDCPGCGSKMEKIEGGKDGEFQYVECPNPNCDWFEDAI